MKGTSMPWHRSGWLAVPFRWLIGFLFTYAGAVKIADPAGFALAIYNYKLLPGWAINPLAIALPWVEVLIGLSLLTGIGVRGGVLLAALCLAIFAGALGINVARGLDVACGCFSTTQEGDHPAWLYVVRDTALLAMAGYVWRYDRGRASLGRIRPGEAGSNERATREVA